MLVVSHTYYLASFLFQNGSCEARSVTEGKSQHNRYPKEFLCCITAEFYFG